MRCHRAWRMLKWNARMGDKTGTVNWIIHTPPSIQSFTHRHQLNHWHTTINWITDIPQSIESFTHHHQLNHSHTTINWITHTPPSIESHTPPSIESFTPHQVKTVYLWTSCAGHCQLMLSATHQTRERGIAAMPIATLAWGRVGWCRRWGNNNTRRARGTEK